MQTAPYSNGGCSTSVQLTNGTTCIGMQGKACNHGSDIHSCNSNLSAKIKDSHELRSDYLRHKSSHHQTKSSSRIVPAILLSLFALLLMGNTAVSFFYFQPNLYSADSRLKHSVLYGFCLIQILVNFYKIVASDSSFHSHRVDLSTGLEGRANWTFCLICNQERPPRCTHCFDCKKCVLKRDHHCMLFANCIAHYNLRYFLVFLCYFLYLSMMIVVQTYEFVSEFHVYAIDEMTHASPSLVMFIPFWSFGLLVYGHVLTFALIAMLQINFSILLLSILYCGWMLNIMLEGQTSYEALHDVRKYGRGWRYNVREVFGTAFPIIYFILPVNLSLPSSGLHWEQRFGNINSI